MISGEGKTFGAQLLHEFAMKVRHINAKHNCKCNRNIKASPLHGQSYTHYNC